MYKIVLISPDGEDFKVDCEGSKTIEDVIYADSLLGSKWFFYPIHFIVKDSNTNTLNNRILPINGDDGVFPHLVGKTVKTAMEFIKNNPNYISFMFEM